MVAVSQVLECLEDRKIWRNVGFKVGLSRGANDASRVRVQLSSSRVVNISSRAYSSRVLTEF